MLKTALGMLLSALAFAAMADGGIRSWDLWRDTEGHVINAHGGGVTYDQGAYWWYGEHKVYGEQGNRAMVGVHAYRSEDLVHWADRGIALKVSDDPSSEIVAGCVIERPKVIRNPKSGNYVMYFHLELKGRGYEAAKTGIALSNRPEGPFVLVKTLRPNGAMSRDMTLFVDDDGKAYHFFSSESNRTMHVDELTDDYLGYTGRSVRICENDETEAPAVFKHGGWYWLIGSGCSGWTPNTARLYRAKSVFGPWERLGNPCRGRNPNNGMGPELTWGGQSAFVLPIHGDKDGFIAMFDIWRPHNQIDSRYIWMPVRFDAEGLPFFEWIPEWMPNGRASGRGASFKSFDARARAGERLSVVFFGGSLTWSANASEPNVTGFRGLMAKHLAEKYPSAHFSFHDASIGGTGSTLGVFRLQRDVLSKKPDLVFLDFSCNDGGDNTDLAPTCFYESLLREMIGRGIPVQQMLFTFRPWVEPGVDPHRVHPRRDVYLELAKAYGTPVGDVYVTDLCREVQSGKIPADVLWPIDGGHPGDRGYRMFADAGIAGFERAVREGAVCRVPEKPVFGTVTDVVRQNPAEGELPAGWTRKPTYRTSLWYDGLSSRWMEDVAAFSGTSRAPLAVRATGNFVGVFGEADEDALDCEVSADGKNVATFRGYHGAGKGRLFIWRPRVLDGWESGTGVSHAFSFDPVPSDDGAGEFRIGSICTATIVPSAAPAAQSSASGPGLDEIDHARGTASRCAN